MKEGVVCSNFPSRESAAAAPQRREGRKEREAVKDGSKGLISVSLCRSLTYTYTRSRTALGIDECFWNDEYNSVTAPTPALAGRQAEGCEGWDGRVTARGSRLTRR